jgi:hypothetical protein
VGEHPLVALVGGVEERLSAQALSGQRAFAVRLGDVGVDVVHHVDTEEHDVAAGNLLGEGALLELVALHDEQGLVAPAGARCAVHGGVELAGDVDGIGIAADLPDGSLRVPETVRTARDLLVRPRQVPGMIRW